MSIIKCRENELLIRELEAHDEGDMAVMQAIFSTLMPQYAHYSARLQRDIQHAGDARSEVRHHVWLVEVSGVPAAMCAFEYVRSENVGLGMDIAIYPQYRALRHEGKTLAHFILHEMVSQLALDGAEADQSPAVPMGGEVEGERLLVRYMDYGFIPIPATYFEPPDVSGKADIAGAAGIPLDAESQLQAAGYHRMGLGFFPPDQPDFNPFDISLWERLLKAFYIHHYHLAPHTLALQLALESLRPIKVQPTRSVA
jgi:hypothetical protein